MALGRGENIGEAYVRIVYSGEGAHLSKDIRDDLERDTPAFEAIGEEHSKAYDKGFKKEINKDSDVTMETLRKSLDKGTGKMEATGGKASSALMDGLEQDLKAKFGDDVGNVMAQSLRERLQRGGTFTSVQKEMSSNLEGLVRDATQKLQAGEHQTLADQEKFTRDFRTSLDKISSDADRAWNSGQNAVEQYRFSLDKLAITNERTRVGLGKMVRDLDQENSKFETNHRWLAKINKDLDGFANKVGSAFGKGNRNNFINVIGSMVQGGVELLAILPKMAQKVAEFTDKFNAVRKSDGLLSALGPVALSVAGGLAAMAIAITAVILLLGPMVSLLSGLLAILIALASTVLFAAAAGIAAVAGALVPLAVGVLATVAAFSAMKVSSSKIGPQMTALKNVFHDLGKEVAKPLFAHLPQQLDSLKSVVQQLGPVAHAAGVGMSDFFSSILKGLHSSAFQLFEAKFSKVLPGMLHRLGVSFASLLTAFTGLFRGAIPLIQNFLKWLQKVTGEFSQWANSADGQHQIRQFLRDAAASAQSLVGFLGQVGGLLLDLANQGRSAGNQMFDGLTAAVKRFRAFITEPITLPTPGIGGRKDPTGDLVKSNSSTLNRLDEWFSFAQQLAAALGTAVVEAGKLMSEFDDKDSRQNLLTILNILDTALALVASFASVWKAGVINPIGSAISAVKNFFSALSGFNASRLVKQFDLGHLFGGSNFNVGQMIKLPNIAALAAHFAGLGGKILKQIGIVNVSGIIHGASTALGRLLGAFAGAAGKVLSHISPVNVANIITGAATALSKLLGTFTGAAKKVLDKVSPVNVAGIFSGLAAAAATLIGWAHTLAQIIAAIFSNISIHINWPSPPSWLGKIGLHTAAGGVFAGAQTRIIGEAGPEAVVPLNRPLNMVDPAVRWLSAIAQGKDLPMAAGGVVAGGKQMTVTQNIFSPQADPRAVAVEAINHLTAVGY